MNRLTFDCPWPRSVSGLRTRSPVPPGFSLIELMLVMVLAVGLFGLVGTSIRRSVGAAEIRNEVREVVAGLRHTRGQAVIQRSEQVFTVDAENRSWQAASREAQALPEGLDITLSTARSELTGENAGGIRFYPDGASTGGSITLSVDERKWYVTVGWLTGEISRDPPEDGR
ncbi:MAG: GspH/FimT family pseudopilin [Wenzhouxiangellaceae bacterium]|nr:GspH/FimT family pseudopilin [Wenzhouxiangellaceae bacterium]